MMKDVGELPEDAIWSEFDFFVLFLYLFIHYYICIVQVYIMMKDVGELPEDAIWSEFDVRSCCIKIMGYNGTYYVFPVCVCL
jgi:hypothetical protein